jgi:hypothetical protein
MKSRLSGRCRLVHSDGLYDAELREFYSINDCLLAGKFTSNMHIFLTKTGELHLAKRATTHLYYQSESLVVPDNRTTPKTDYR